MDWLDQIMADELNSEDEDLLRAADYGGDAHVFSKRYTDAMIALCSGKKRTPWTVICRRLLVAAAIIALLVGTAGAFWGEITSFFVQRFDRYSDLRMTQYAPDMESIEVDRDFVPEDWGRFWFPAVLPADYSLVSAQTIETCYSISFENGEGKSIQFVQWPGITGHATDDEGTPLADVYIGSCKAVGLEKDINGEIYRLISWTDGETSFELVGVLGMDELVAIGERLVLIEE